MEVVMSRTEEIRAILGISRAEFSRRYNIPLRTLEEWDAGRRTPPTYVIELLERVVTEDKNKN
jgi:putative transcriptional regulator